MIDPTTDPFFPPFPTPSGMQALKTVERYSRAKNEWVPVNSMPMQRRGAACCGLDGKLYVAGGYQDGYEVGKNNGKGFLFIRN